MSTGDPPSKRPASASASAGRLGAIAGGKPFGRYVLDERIAIGGTADVFLAHPASGDKPAPRLVIKRLLASLRGDASARAMFEEEAVLHGRFSHPNIVKCYEAGEADGEPYLAMELVQGADLHRVVRLGQARKRPLAAPIATWIAREVLSALHAVHEARADDGTPLGIVHRDVSPSNIYLSSSGLVKLGDFGIARAASTRTPKAGSLGTAIRGKFAYLAPEQVASEAVDHRADLFAVANVLAEMMIGKPLFPGSGQLAVLLSIRDTRIEALEQATTVPPPLVAILRKALSRSPDARFPDAASFGAAIAPFAWQDRATAEREIAQLVRWARETSLELRAVGEHPDQRPMMSVAPPTAPDEMQATPVRPVPAYAQGLKLDPELLASLEIRDGGSEPPPTPSPASDKVTAPFAPPPSHVRTADGRLLGPYSYAKLAELVATGRIGGDDKVDFMGTGFVELHDIDELSRHLAPRSTATKQIDGPGAPDWQALAAERWDDAIGGALDPGIATALGYVAGRRATGVLLAQQGSRRKEIYFVNGRLFHVASTDPGELIGEYLVSHGLLDRSDLDFALAVLPRFNGHLGEALTGLGLLEPVAMFKAIQEQGRAKVVDLFSWKDGELSFYADALAGKVEFPLDLPIAPILEAGVASMLDDFKATARYKPWLDRKLVVVESPAPLRDAGWSPRVERVLALAKTPVTIRALAKALTLANMSAHDAVRAIEAARMGQLLDWT